MAEMIAPAPETETLDDELDSLRDDVADDTGIDEPVQDAETAETAAEVTEETSDDDDNTADEDETDTAPMVMSDEADDEDDDDNDVSDETESVMSSNDVDEDTDEEESVSLQERLHPLVSGAGAVVGRVRDVVGRVDWVGMAQNTKMRVSEQMEARVPTQYHIVVYAVVGLLLLGLPVGAGAWVMLAGGGTEAVVTSDDTLPVNQTSEASGGIIAPSFTPAVQQWATDLERWTSGTDINADYLAVVMQLGSCGNPNYAAGGLFALVDAPTGNNDAAAQAALTRLQTGLSLTEGDWQRALAYYVDGESVLTSDFMTWSLEARDMFIIGRQLYVQARNEYTSSQALQSWLQSTGNVRCTEAQQARN